MGSTVGTTEARPQATLDRLRSMYPHLADDIEQEAELARLEGCDDDETYRRASAVCSAERKHAHATDAMIDYGTKPPVATRPKPQTPGQRWRFRRNVVICVAHKNGVSQRVLADVFDLPRSRIQAIVKEFTNARD